MNLYRYEDHCFAAMCDEFGRSEGKGTVRVLELEYEVLKETAHGAWINYGCGKRFVKLNARKRFACRTKAEAIASFLARKARQRKIYEARLEQIDEALNDVKRFIKPFCWG